MKAYKYLINDHGKLLSIYKKELDCHDLTVTYHKEMPTRKGAICFVFTDEYVSKNPEMYFGSFEGAELWECEGNLVQKFGTLKSIIKRSHKIGLNVSTISIFMTDVVLIKRIL